MVKKIYTMDFSGIQKGYKINMQDVGDIFQRKFKHRFHNVHYNLAEMRCCFTGCKSPCEVIYLGHPFCEEHTKWLDRQLRKIIENISCEDVFEGPEEGDNLTEEEEMAKKSKSKSKKVTKTAKKTKKEANSKGNGKETSIRDFVIEKLQSGEHTKRDLAKAIMKAGLTQSTEEARVIKYLNVMFFKLRKSGVSLKRKDKEKEKGSGKVGYYSLSK